MSSEALVKVTDMVTNIYTERGVVQASNNINFEIGQSKTLGIVGESGCGKSITALSIIHLLPRAARTVQGKVLLDGENLLEKSEEELQKIRGKKMLYL